MSIDTLIAALPPGYAFAGGGSGPGWFTFTYRMPGGREVRISSATKAPEDMVPDLQASIRFEQRVERAAKALCVAQPDFRKPEDWPNWTMFAADILAVVDADRADASKAPAVVQAHLEGAHAALAAALHNAERMDREEYLHWLRREVAR